MSLIYVPEQENGRSNLVYEGSLYTLSRSDDVLADMHGEAIVRGVDLSPIQPKL
jgi:hypothetical protein